MPPSVLESVDAKINLIQTKAVTIHNYYYYFLDPKAADGFWDKRTSPERQAKEDQPKWSEIHHTRLTYDKRIRLGRDGIADPTISNTMQRNTL